MLGKTQVYEYVSKLRAKALLSINKDYDAQLEAAIEAYLNDPENVELKTAIENYLRYSSLLEKEVQTITRISGKSLNLSFSDVMFQLFRSWSPMSAETVNVIQADREIMIKKVKDEYRKIEAIVKGQRNGQAAKEKLIALGFDVEYLNKQENYPVVINPQTITVDKSLLFPCKENFV